MRVDPSSIRTDDGRQHGREVRLVALHRSSGYGRVLNTFGSPRVNVGEGNMERGRWLLIICGDEEMVVSESQ